MDGDPGLGDAATVAYKFTDTNMSFSGDTISSMRFKLFLGIDDRVILFNQPGQTIQIDPVTIDLERYDGGELVAVTVLPRLAAHILPEPTTLLTLGAGLNWISGCHVEVSGECHCCSENTSHRRDRSEPNSCLC